MNRNQDGQKLTLLVIDISNNRPLINDAANLTAYVQIDDGNVTPLSGSATQIDPIKSEGLYSWNLTRQETDGAKLMFTGVSLTPNAKVVPLLRYTTLVPSVPNAGAVIISTVRPGGKIVLKAGDDYVASEVYTVDVPIDDPDGTAHTLLTRTGTASIKFGAAKSRSGRSDAIVGTGNKATVHRVGTKTIVPVEILGSQLTNLVVGDNWEYDIQVTSSAGKKRTVCTASLEIEQDNAT